MGTQWMDERETLRAQVDAIPEHELRESLQAFALENWRLRRLLHAAAEGGESWGIVEASVVGQGDEAQVVGLLVCCPGDEETLARTLVRELRLGTVERVDRTGVTKPEGAR
jgi:hypothetical protein